MSQSEDRERYSEDLQEVADILRERCPALGPLELDRIKRRTMSSARRSIPSQRRGFSLRSRLVAFLTVGMLALGAGTAIAGFVNFGGGFSGYFDGGSASYHQYRPPCKYGYNFGNDRKCHAAPPGQYYWHFIHGWCWIPNGNGGFTWGYGNGWVFE
jgi:hypothetical protein